MHFHDRLVAAYNWAWDVRYGVETRRHVAHPADTGNAYEPVGVHHVRELLSVAARHVPIATTTVIDVGSGKGRPALVAAREPYRAVIGVEHAPGLHRIAEENLRRYRGVLRAPVRFVCADARTFDWPLTPLVLLFFNPFPDGIMRHVIARVRQSWETERRGIVLLRLGRYTAREPFTEWSQLSCVVDEAVRSAYVMRGEGDCGASRTRVQPLVQPASA